MSRSLPTGFGAWAAADMHFPWLGFGVGFAAAIPTSATTTTPAASMRLTGAP